MAPLFFLRRWGDLWVCGQARCVHAARWALMDEVWNVFAPFRDPERKEM